MSLHSLLSYVRTGLLFLLFGPLAITLIMAFVLYAAVFPRDFRKTAEEVTEAATLKATADALVPEFLRAYAEAI